MSDGTDCPEQFSVDCPGCGEQKDGCSTAMTHAGYQCHCGIVFTIDIENQQVGDILKQ